MEEIYTVYVLYSAIFDKIYIGYTNNLIQRFQSHNQLGVKDWTKYSRG
jgi:putative endonuclease